MEKKEILKKSSVQFLYKELKELIKGNSKACIKYEYRENSLVHVVELNFLERLTKPWIKLMYDFDDTFSPETVLFVLKNDAPALKIKKPVFKILGSQGVIEYQEKEHYKININTAIKVLTDKCNHILSNSASIDYSYKSLADYQFDKEHCSLKLV